MFFQSKSLLTYLSILPKVCHQGSSYEVKTGAEWVPGPSLLALSLLVLDQRSENHSLWAKYRLVTCFASKIDWSTVMLIICLLSVPFLVLEQQSWIVATETAIRNPKYLLLDPLLKKFSDFWSWTLLGLTIQSKAAPTATGLTLVTSFEIGCISVWEDPRYIPLCPSLLHPPLGLLPN